ncbi:hypothetical protein J3R82DRAFT_2058, partial [Butyriboletus roseoflavus]
IQGPPLHLFTTKNSPDFIILLDSKLYELSQLRSTNPSLAKPIPFDFLFRGAVVRTTLGGC